MRNKKGGRQYDRSAARPGSQQPLGKRRIWLVDRLKTAVQSGTVRTLSDEERKRHEQELLKRDAPPAPEEE